MRVRKSVIIMPVVACLVTGADAGLQARAPSKPHRPETLSWGARPLDGIQIPSHRGALEIRGFALGQCAIPPAAMDQIAREAAAAARLTQTGLRVTIRIAGGADGMPVRGALSQECTRLAPSFKDANQRLAAARAAQLKHHFQRAFAKSGVDPSLLTWVDDRPVVTPNRDQPHDRNAVAHLTWSGAAPTARSSLQKRTP